MQSKLGLVAILLILGVTTSLFPQPITPHSAIAQTTDDRKTLADQLRQQGKEQYEANKFQEALGSYKQASKIYQDIGDRRREAWVLNKIGDVHRNMSQYTQAIAFYEKSLAIHRDLGDRLFEAYSLNALGLAYYDQGEFTKAIAFYEKSLAIRRDLNFRIGDGEASTLNNLGLAHYHQGKYSKAITLYEKVLAKKPSLRLQSLVLGNLGGVFMFLGQFAKAIAFYEQSLAIKRNIDDRLGESRSLNNLGLAYHRLGQYDKAISFHEQSLTIKRDIGYRKGEASSLSNLGFAYSAQSQPDKAISFHEQSLDISRDIGDLYSEAISLNNLGFDYLKLGQIARAISFYEQSLGIRRDIGDREGEGRSLSEIGYALDRIGETDLAINFLKQSVNVREGIRTDIQGLSKDLQESYTQTVAGAYRKLADLLIARGRIPEAQQVLELLKVQELNDFNQGTRSPDKLSQIGLNPAEKQIKAEHGTLIAFGRKFYDCEQANCNQLESLRTQYKALDKAFYQLAAEITQQVEANRQQQVASDTNDFQDSADEVVTAHEKSVLLYPLVLPDKVRLLWAAKGGVLGNQVCNLTEADLNLTVSEFQTLLSSSTSDLAQVKSVGKQLYDCLVKPIEPELQANGIQHLIFVPDRVTHYIPMGALFDGKQFLIQRFRISNILSAGLTDTKTLLPNISQQVSVLGLGLYEARPPFQALQHVKAELDTIVREEADDPKGIYSGRSFLNKDFNVAALENNLRDRQIVHIATHGEFVPTNPRDSYLLLGTGEKYPIPDIQTLRQLRGVHLVVLSACETAKGGDDHNGIEVAGISSYFLRGKAKAVLASLWKVNDASTSQLMQQFYQNLATGKMSKAEAVRQAQIAMITGKKATSSSSDRSSVALDFGNSSTSTSIPRNFSHPYYWAPFILIGNGL